MLFDTAANESRMYRWAASLLTPDADAVATIDADGYRGEVCVTRGDGQFVFLEVELADEPESETEYIVAATDEGERLIEETEDAAFREALSAWVLGQ